MELNLIITIADRSRIQALTQLYAEQNLHLIFTKLGTGTATSEQLSLYGLQATPKAIVSAVAGPEATALLLRSAKQKLYIDIPGNGIMMAVPLKSVGGGKTLAFLTDNKPVTGGTPTLQFRQELIVVILNEGHSEQVMDAARSVGAVGGTVLHAKGTGAKRAETFYGVSFAEEKDVIYIVSGTETKTGIMQAITRQVGPGTPAGAICFSLPITAIAGLRQLDE